MYLIQKQSLNHEHQRALIWIRSGINEVAFIYGSLAVCQLINCNLATCIRLCAWVEPPLVIFHQMLTNLYWLEEVSQLSLILLYDTPVIGWCTVYRLEWAVVNTTIWYAYDYCCTMAGRSRRAVSMDSHTAVVTFVMWYHRDVLLTSYQKPSDMSITQNE